MDEWDSVYKLLGAVGAGLLSAWGGRTWITHQNAKAQRNRTDGTAAEQESKLIGTLAEREQLSFDRAEAMRAQMDAQHAVVSGLRNDISAWSHKYSTLKTYYEKMRDRYKEQKNAMTALEARHAECEANYSKLILEMEAVKQQLKILEKFVEDIQHRSVI